MKEEKSFLKKWDKPKKLLEILKGLGYGEEIPRG
jgi:hypothetical protein